MTSNCSDHRVHQQRERHEQPRFAKQDKHHNFSIHVAIEKTVKKGSYTIGGRCGGGNLGSAATLKVS